MSSVKDTPSSFDDAPQYVQSYITYKDEKDVAIVIAVIQIFISGCQRYDVFLAFCENYLWNQQAL